jgi:hypothetical protein
MKVVAENVHLISKNPLGDPICRSWTLEYLFKFRDLGSIDMNGNLQYVKCTKFKSDKKNVPGPKPKPGPKPSPKSGSGKFEIFSQRQLQKVDEEKDQPDLEDVVGRSRALLDTNFFFNLFCIIPNIFMTLYILEIGVLVYKYQVLKTEKDDRLKWLKRYKRQNRQVRFNNLSKLTLSGQHDQQAHPKGRQH